MKTVYYADPLHDDFAGNNIRTKKALKWCKGYFLYGNHTQCPDAYLPPMVAAPRRTCTVANLDPALPEKEAAQKLRDEVCNAMCARTAGSMEYIRYIQKKACKTESEVL